MSGTISINSPFYFWIGFIGFGFLAFLFSALSVFFDKKRKQYNMNPMKGLVRYLGMFIIFVGFIFNLFYLPYNRIIIIAGIVLTAASIFMKAKADKTVDTDVLDDDF